MLLEGDVPVLMPPLHNESPTILPIIFIGNESLEGSEILARLICGLIDK